MSRHDCCVAATLTVKDGVARDQIAAAVQEFLEEHGLSFEKLVESSSIQFDEPERMLYLSIEMYSYGGAGDDSVDALVESLAPLVEPDWLLLRDYDTGDLDEASVPYFIAEDKAEVPRLKAKYGIAQMVDWVQPVVGEDAFKSIEALILAAACLPAPAPQDDVPVGTEGKLVTLDGRAIDGVRNILPGTAWLDRAIRQADGSLELASMNETDVAWNEQAPEKSPSGEILFVTEDREIVPQSQVKLVAIA